MAATDTEGDSAAPGARERILDASYHLFSRQGVQAVGIDAIITRSGVARQTLYRHFDSQISRTSCAAKSADPSGEPRRSTGPLPSGTGRHSQ